MEQILSLWPGHGYGPMLPQQSFLSVLILLFSMAKIGGNTQVCCSERRAGREKLFRGTLAFSELCPTVRRGTANCLFKLQRDRQWRDAPVSSQRPAGSRERQGPIQHLAVSCQLQDFPTLQLAPAHNFLRTFTSYISVSWASTWRSFLSGVKEDEILRPQCDMERKCKEKKPFWKNKKPKPLGERYVMSSQDLQNDTMNLKYIEQREAILPCCGELSMNFHLGEPCYDLIQSNLRRI